MSNSNDFEEYYRRVMQMRRLTENEIINTYWQHLEEIADNGFVPFILRGSLCWESPGSTKLESNTGSVWLQSDYYDPIGKSITDQPVKRYLQRHLNLHQIWGGMYASVDPQNAETSKEALAQVIQDIYLLCNVISLTSGTSIIWYPARFMNVKVESVPLSPQEESSTHTEWRCIPLPRKQEEGTSTHVKDGYFVDEALPIFEHIRNTGNEELEALLRRAMAWHATGSFLGSGLNRFLNYWESIELLAHFFYQRLPRELTGRPSKSEKKDEVLRILSQPITRRNCLEVASQCARIVPSTPSARTVIQSTLAIITGRENISEALFGKDSETSKSLYDIRNDIAHGNHCDHNLEFTDLVDTKLHEISRYSRDAIWLTTQRLRELNKLLEI